MTALPVAGAARTGVATRLYAFLAAYFALQVILRLLAVSSLGLDDAEMVVITQALQPGYGSQPPLYNWLQVAFFAVFGFGAPAIVILHFVLLCAVYVLVFLSARIVLDDERQGGGGVARAVRHPADRLGGAPFAYPHAPLADARRGDAAGDAPGARPREAGSTTSSSASASRSARWPSTATSRSPWHSSSPARPSPRSGRGCCRGGWRRRSSSRSSSLAPHLQWVWTHIDATLSRTSKFKIDDDAGLFLGLARSLAAMLAGVAGYVALSVAVFAAAAFLPLPKGQAAPPEPVRPGPAAWPRLRPPRPPGRARHRAGRRARDRRDRGQGTLAAADPVHAAARPDDPGRAAAQPAPRAAADRHPGGDRRSCSWWRWR